MFGFSSSIVQVNILNGLPFSHVGGVKNGFFFVFTTSEVTKLEW